MKVLIARKVGMTSTIAQNGVVEPVTLLSVADNVVTQLKTVDTDGYQAVQVGSTQSKKLSKPLAGHVKKSGATPKVMREFRVEPEEDLVVGSKLTPEVFSIGDIVDVTGTSKGKGWAGTIKRHNFKRGRKTHGGRSYRRPGSIGSMYPQRIFPGTRMSGDMGADRVTIKNLTVAIVDVNANIIGVTGAVPGPRKGIVLIKAQVKKTKGGKS